MRYGILQIVVNSYFMWARLTLRKADASQVEPIARTCLKISGMLAVCLANWIKYLMEFLCWVVNGMGFENSNFKALNKLVCKTSWWRTFEWFLILSWFGYRNSWCSLWHVTVMLVPCRILPQITMANHLATCLGVGVLNVLMCVAKCQCCQCCF